VTSFVPALYEKVNINKLTTAIQAIDSNSLATSQGFSLTYNGSYTSTLQPTNKYNQFVVIDTNIIILPILITSPHSVVVVSGGVVTTTLSIVHSGTAEQFSTFGGYGSMTYTKDSGTGSITSGGLYTPPGSAGSAVIRATDTYGNYITCAITIT
jgi:hypothetical protein